MSTEKLHDLTRAAGERNRQELRQISRLLAIADRYAALALRAWDAHDLLRARSRFDRACDAEGEALGDCEGYGYPRELLGEECPWTVRGHYSCASSTRLVLSSTCLGEQHDGGKRCPLFEGAVVRSFSGHGLVSWIMTEETLSLIDAAPMAPVAVCVWMGPVPSIVWRVERLTHPQDL